MVWLWLGWEECVLSNVVLLLAREFPCKWILTFWARLGFGACSHEPSHRRRVLFLSGKGAKLKPEVHDLLMIVKIEFYGKLLILWRNQPNSWSLQTLLTRTKPLLKEKSDNSSFTERKIWRNGARHSTAFASLSVPLVPSPIGEENLTSQSIWISRY